MRIISLLVAFCFTMNVMASTGTVQELERAFDDYHFSLSVEWDQKDQTFYDTKTKEFFSKLENMIKNEGLTQEQIMTLVKQRANNDKVVEALKLKMNLLGKGSSVEDLTNMMRDSSKDLYSQGASWNGAVVMPVVIGVLIIAAIGYSIWWDANHECVAWENQYICTTHDNCSYSGGYYDSYGNYYAGGNYCYGPSYTTCGYTDVCVRYEKK